jgi:hypothetical protein
MMAVKAAGPFECYLEKTGNDRLSVRRFPGYLIAARSRHVQHPEQVSKGLATEQAPQKTMRGLFLMQRLVKRDVEGHQYPYR